MSASQLARAAALGIMPPPPLPERLRTRTTAAAPGNQKSSKKSSPGNANRSTRGTSTDPTKKTTQKPIEKKVTRKQAIAATKALLKKLEKNARPKKPKPDEVASRQVVAEKLAEKPAEKSAEKSAEKQVENDEKENKKKRNKKQLLADVHERYHNLGLTPPPPINNQFRFRVFIDRINRRQWDSMPRVATSTMKYNGERMPLQVFIQIMKQEFGSSPVPINEMEVLTLVGGETHPNPPEGKTMKEGFIRESLAARIAVKKVDSNQPEYTRHMVAHFFRGKVSSLYDIREEAPRGKKQMADKLRPESPVLRPPPPPVPVDLQKFYKDYIAAINLGPEKMAQEVPKFCKPSGVVHNGVHLPVEKYITLMQDAMENVADLKFRIHTLVVDKQKQTIAARLDFKGTPVKTYMGAAPTGEEVEWNEHVFYWLENSKISDVISIVDWDTYREALGQE